MGFTYPDYILIRIHKTEVLNFNPLLTFKFECMATNVLAQVYETLLCSPGMNEAVKVDVKINRKTVLLLSSVIENGLNKKDGQYLDFSDFRCLMANPRDISLKNYSKKIF